MDINEKRMWVFIAAVLLIIVFSTEQLIAGNK